MSGERPVPFEPLLPGAELAPGYVVVAHISRNQALDVYDLLSVERGCRCVAKVVRPDREDDRAPARLVREAEVLLSLTHPHIVRAYELVTEPEPALILETLAGATIGSLVEELGPMPAEDVAELGLQLGSALGYLHRRGWLHLDLKPDNVIAEAGSAKLIDLSLTLPPGRVPAGIGTPGWRAPEQDQGTAGPAADVYGLGTVLDAVAGHDLPRRMAAAIDRCLRPDPAARPTLDELEDALRPYGHEAAELRAAA